MCVACASFAANNDGNSARTQLHPCLRAWNFCTRARLASLVFAHKTAHCVAPQRVFTAAHSSFIIRRHAGVLALLLLLDHSIIPFQALSARPTVPLDAKSRASGRILKGPGMANKSCVHYMCCRCRRRCRRIVGLRVCVGFVCSIHSQHVRTTDTLSLTDTHTPLSGIANTA